MESSLTDTGERRSGIERRRFSYAHHIPERRRSEDRRKEEEGFTDRRPPFTMQSHIPNRGLED